MNIQLCRNRCDVLIPVFNLDGLSTANCTNLNALLAKARHIYMETRYMLDSARESGAVSRAEVLSYPNYDCAEYNFRLPVCKRHQEISLAADMIRTMRQLNRLQEEVGNISIRLDEIPLLRTTRPAPSTRDPRINEDGEFHCSIVHP